MAASSRRASQLLGSVASRLLHPRGYAAAAAAPSPAVFVDKSTRVICQGITGKNGNFHTELAALPVDLLRAAWRRRWRSRSSSSRCSRYYYPRKGTILRSTKNAKNYLQDNPDSAVDLQKVEFLFKIPESLQNYLRRCFRQSKPLEPNEVLLLSRSPPTHEDLAPNCMLALYDESQYCM